MECIITVSEIYFCYSYDVFSLWFDVITGNGNYHKRDNMINELNIEDIYNLEIHFFQKNIPYNITINVV